MGQRGQLIYGVGINDADYSVYKTAKVDGKRKILWSCPFYKMWSRMLERAYSLKTKEKYPTYKDCTVSDEWLRFSNFKAWMETQDWEGKQLDKDLLVKGNKEYSADTCIFLESKVNVFINSLCQKEGKIIKGYGERPNNRFQAFCSILGKQKYLGAFGSRAEANNAWREVKLNELLELINQQSDQRIKDALKVFYRDLSLEEQF